jgi:NAD-dependent SIR2 family protein deacetylase
MKIIAEHGGMLDIFCEKCVRNFMFPMVRCGPDTIVWCPYCQNWRRWEEVIKFPKEDKK